MGSQLENIVIGTLLGDGFLEKNGKNSRLVIDHSEKQSEYVQWLKESLLPIPVRLSIVHRFDKRTRKEYVHHILRTHSMMYFNSFREMFYKGNRKHIPENLPKIINPQILAIWIMDDGYRRNDCNAMRINTQSYNFSDHLIIKESLQKLSIQSSIQRHKDRFVLYIPSQSMCRLRQYVCAYIIDPMMYKIA